MGLALRRIKVYGKLALVGAILVVILLVVLLNRNNVADVWFFHTFEKINVLYLMLVTAAASVVVFWGTMRIRGVIREAREVCEERIAAERLAAQKRMADELTDRERRIDEKLRRSIAGEEETGRRPNEG